MLTKIYLAVLAVSVAILGFFTYYAWSWLQSIGLPTAAAEGYGYHSGLGWLALWICSLLLLFLGAGVLWSTRHAWGVWAAFGFFAVFTVLQSFWLDSAFRSFKQSNSLATSGFSGLPILAVVSILGMAALAFLAQFAIIRLHRKTYQLDAPPSSETPAPPDPGDEAEK